MRLDDPTSNVAHASWLKDADVGNKASAQNLEFEERVSISRQADLEIYTISRALPEDLRSELTNYWREEVLLADKPAPFRLGSGSLIPSPSPEQKLIRIENLSDVLLKTGMDASSLANMVNQKKPAQIRTLEWFCIQWNTRPDIRRNPVSFATFKDQHLSDLCDANWPLLLRDRLGLAHLAGSSTNQIPIALMEYEVAEVGDWSRRAARFSQPFVVPTAIDQQPYGHFYPTPIETPYGCPMALRPIESERDLVAELLHPRIPYRAEHLVQVATIAADRPRFALDELRNSHLIAIRLDSGRDDFGAEI